MSSQTASTACASVVSFAGGLFCHIEENATVLNTIISATGVIGAFIFGGVSVYSMKVARRKDKASADNLIEINAIKEEGLKRFNALQKDNLRLMAKVETLKIKESLRE